MALNRNILLIYPPHKEECKTPEVPPLGLAYMASFIKKQTDNRYKISLWDLNRERIDKDEFKRRLLNLKDKPEQSDGEPGAVHHPGILLPGTDAVSR